MSREKIKQEHNGSPIFESTSGNVTHAVARNATRKTFSILKKIRKNNLWVSLPIDKIDMNPPEIQAAMSELWGALSPPNSAAKLRVLTKKDGTQVLISKRISNFRASSLKNLHIEKNRYTDDELDYAASQLAIMHALEEYDLNAGNIDVRSQKRIDFEITPCTLKKNIWQASFSFSRVACSLNNAFEVDAIDYRIFPNSVIAKPFNIFDLKKHEGDLATLQYLNEKPRFTKTADQYFLKTLLFNKSLITPILATHLDEKQAQELADHFELRFQKMKLALVQVPRFRENVKDNFTEYKKNIINEFKSYNLDFEKGMKKYPNVNSKMHLYYKSRKIDIKKIEHDLDKLHELTKNCDLVSKGELPELAIQVGTALNCSYNKNNRFHQYVAQLLMVMDKTVISQQEIFDSTNRQFQIKKMHLKSAGLDIWLKNIHVNTSDLNLASELMYYINSVIDDALVESESNITNGLSTSIDIIKNKIKKLTNLPKQVRNEFFRMDNSLVFLQDAYEDTRNELIKKCNANGILKPLLEFYPDDAGDKDQDALKLLCKVAYADVDSNEYDQLMVEVKQNKKINPELHAIMLKTKTATQIKNNISRITSLNAKFIQEDLAQLEQLDTLNDLQFEALKRYQLLEPLISTVADLIADKFDLVISNNGELWAKVIQASMGLINDPTNAQLRTDYLALIDEVHLCGHYKAFSAMRALFCITTLACFLFAIPQMTAIIGVGASVYYLAGGLLALLNTATTHAHIKQWSPMYDAMNQVATSIVDMSLPKFGCK